MGVRLGPAPIYRDPRPPGTSLPCELAADDPRGYREGRPLPTKRPERRWMWWAWCRLTGHRWRLLRTRIEAPPEVGESLPSWLRRRRRYDQVCERCHTVQEGVGGCRACGALAWEPCRASAHEREGSSPRYTISRCPECGLHTIALGEPEEPSRCLCGAVFLTPPARTGVL